MVSSGDNSKKHMNGFCNSEVTIVAIHQPCLVTLRKVLELLDSVHLNPYSMHDAHDVFEPVKNNGVLFVPLFAIFNFTFTFGSLLCLLLFALFNERFDGARLRVLQLVLLVAIKDVPMNQVFHKVHRIQILLLVIISWSIVVVVRGYQRLLFHF